MRIVCPNDCRYCRTGAEGGVGVKKGAKAQRLNGSMAQQHNDAEVQGDNVDQLNMH